MSHSQLLEWISGSFIQSHWPCMTLWPISMFSRILATPEHGRAGDERGPAGALAVASGEQRDAPAGGEAALDPDHPVDVRRVGGVARLLDLRADRVELAAELLDLVRR